MSCLLSAFLAWNASHGRMLVVGSFPPAFRLLVESWACSGSRLVQSNWFGRIFHEAKRDRLPGSSRSSSCRCGDAPWWSRCHLCRPVGWEIDSSGCSAMETLIGIETYPKMFSAEYMEGREKLFVEAMLEADIESKVVPSIAVSVADSASSLP
eukprot:scaffold2927_cov408-Prasinococcus_capsulatus_cf.AAC.14